MIFNPLNIAGLFIFICGCLFLYLTAREESRVPFQPEPDNTEPFRCPICAYFYPAEKEEEFSSCPRCGTINRKEDA